MSPRHAAQLSREQVLAFRRRAGSLGQRLPPGSTSLQRAAWPGLTDSMPRAALLSLHARVEGTTPRAWQDPALLQLWGPRFSAYVVAAPDLAVFSLGRLPVAGARQRHAEDLADRLHAALGGRELPYGQAGRLVGEHPNQLRYAAATGRVLIRWDGARQPVVRTVPPPPVDPHEARLELARRYVHTAGVAPPEAFARWAGVHARAATATFDALAAELMPVRTPVGESLALSVDEPDLRATPSAPHGVRLLPSGDPYLLLHGRERELLVPDAGLRADLWPPRVWPGAVLVDGEVAGTWRRAEGRLTVRLWNSLPRSAREAVEAEASALPLPGLEVGVVVRWEGGGSAGGRA